MAKSVYIGVTSFNRPYLSLLGLKAVGQKAGGGGIRKVGKTTILLRVKILFPKKREIYRYSPIAVPVLIPEEKDWIPLYRLCKTALNL